MPARTCKPGGGRRQGPPGRPLQAACRQRTGHRRIAGTGAGAEKRAEKRDRFASQGRFGLNKRTCPAFPARPIIPAGFVPGVAGVRHRGVGHNVDVTAAADRFFRPVDELERELGLLAGPQDVAGGRGSHELAGVGERGVGGQSHGLVEAGGLPRALPGRPRLCAAKTIAAQIAAFLDSLIREIV